MPSSVNFDLYKQFYEYVNLNNSQEFDYDELYLIYANFIKQVNVSDFGKQWAEKYQYLRGWNKENYYRETLDNKTYETVKVFRISHMVEQHNDFIYELYNNILLNGYNEEDNSMNSIIRSHILEFKYAVVLNPEDYKKDYINYYKKYNIGQNEIIGIIVYHDFKSLTNIQDGKIVKNTANKISFNVFADYLVFLWVAKMKYNISFGGIDLLKLGIVGDADSIFFNNRIDIKNTILIDTDEISFRTDRRLIILNLDMNYIYRNRNAKNNDLNYNFINFNSMCNYINAGESKYELNYSRRMLSSEIFDEKAVKLINILCDNFKYNKINSTGSISYRYSNVIYDKNKHIENVLNMNQTLYFPILLKFFLYKEDAIDHSWVSATEYKIDFKTLYKSRIIQDISPLNKSQIDIENKLFKTIEDINALDLFIKPFDNNYARLIESLEGGNGYISLLSKLILFDSILDSGKLNKLSLIVSEFKKVNSDIYKYHAYPLPNETYTYDKLPDDGITVNAELGDKLSNDILNKFNFISNKKDQKLVKRIVLNRMLWFWTKNGYEIARSILEIEVVENLVNKYVNDIYDTLKKYFIKKNKDTGNDEFDKETFVLKYLGSGYDFEKKHIFTYNKYITDKNIDVVFQYIHDSISSGNVRTKLEFIFIFGKMISEYVVLPLFNKLSESEENPDIEKECNENKMDYEYVVERYKILTQKWRIIMQKRLEIEDRDIIKIENRKNAFEKMIKIRNILNAIANDTADARRIIFEDYKTILKSESHFIFYIYANFEFGNLMFERLEIKDWKDMTLGHENTGIDENTMFPKFDSFEFYAEKNNKILVRNRGIDTFRPKSFYGKSRPLGASKFMEEVNDYAKSYLTGISGHASLIFYMTRLFKTNASEDISKKKQSIENNMKIIALASIGYMLPRKDHSIDEIITAGKYYGLNCPEENIANGTCVEWLFPDVYEIEINNEKKTATKLDFMNKFTDITQREFNFFLKNEYISLVYEIYKLLISPEQTEVNKIRKTINEFKFSKNIGLKDNANFDKEIYIIFSIMRREAIEINKSQKMKMYDFETFNNDMNKLNNIKNAISDYYLDYFIYKFEDELYTPINDIKYTLPLYPSFEGNCLYFMKFYFCKWRSAEEKLKSQKTYDSICIEDII
jgi:hypothetical protein